MNPYEVLGVSDSASEEEIKSAYRRLVKKYHPDRFPHGSPEQAEAAEKLKQVNAAYDMITRMKQGSFSGEGAPQYGEVRNAIQRGQIGLAETMLNQMQDRQAEWYYLMGIVLLRRGWYDGAAQNFRTAYQMEPGNREYEHALRAMTQSAGMYEDFGDQDMPQFDMNSTMCRVCGTCACMSVCLGSNCYYPWICCCI
ncbi:MAG: DnaJ domain-containing protein [Clostridia bacterium]|nr:DnaJ domain-containing protein [Clostridia bacterium]